jgi:hypothetical protein
MQKMSSNQLTPEQQAEIEALLALPDEARFPCPYD